MCRLMLGLDRLGINISLRILVSISITMGRSIHCNPLPPMLSIGINPIKHIVNLLQRLAGSLLQEEECKYDNEHIQQTKQQECPPANARLDVRRREAPHEIEQPLRSNTKRNTRLP